MAMILDAFVGKCVERLMNVIEEKAVMVMSVKEDLRRLQSTMVRIKNVLVDAEKKRLEESSTISNWVNELKGAIYDADDIIDLCLIEDSNLLDEQLSSTSNNPSVCYNFSFLSCFRSAPHRYEIGERIKRINDRLDEIYKGRLQFNLLDQLPNKTEVTRVNIRETSPKVPDVVGRELEHPTEDLIKRMTTGGESKCNVFAITGMGGIGKTTLAQNIFNHQTVKTKFQIKVWLCISQNYNEIDLLKQVIRAADGSYGEANTKAELVPLLESAVSGKSIFLVLDDVWRADVWTHLLQSPLQSKQIDALILITSRDKKVAKQMRSVHIHPVEQLPDETGWEMLTRMLGISEEEIYNLREIGIQIIKKCSGLPLAIKVMAGVLANKEPVEKEWKEILNNNAWKMSNLPDELKGALYLSYDDLPSPLKQCFLYCSLYPEDWRINHDDIVRLWVAEGFIKEEKDSSMEDTAYGYCNELTQRNLLQLNRPDYDSAVYYKMHDLLRDLAQFLSRDESFSGNAIEKSIILLTKHRRLSLTGHEKATSVLGAITEQRCLRTLITFNCSQALDFNQLVKFQHLRVLNLKDNEIESIPTIGDLVHLRHLDLDRTLIRQLPESIGRLSNLQFLSLCGCKSLTYLPQSITQLQNLRCLALSDTPLDFIPKGIERLKQLNSLREFVVGEQVAMHSTMEELSSLSRLRILNICKVERARLGSFVLRELSQLKDLKLSCSPVRSDGHENTEHEISLVEKLFEELVPPQCLEELHITYYFGHGYPKWMMSPSLGSYLPYLSILTLWGNISCPLLPPLGQLPNLRALGIAGAKAVKRIGTEFLGAGVAAARSQTITAFPMLEQLLINDMPNLDEWTFFSDEEEEEENDASLKLVIFPRLFDLLIIDCPKLRALPGGLGRTALKKLSVTRADSLKNVEHLPHLAERLYLEKNQSLETISNLPALKSLIVTECYALKCVESLDGLQSLKLTDDSMDCLPGWLPRLIEERLRVGEDDFLLQLWCNEGVLRRCQQGGEDWPVIQQIPLVYAYVRNGGGLLFKKQPFFYKFYESNN